MIHVATVHWQDATWVDIQLDYFARHLADHPYRVYAYLNGIDPEPYRERLHYICTDPVQRHGKKLNLLGQVIGSEADETDIICFIDGDAFPVGDIAGYVKTHLRDRPLVAIERLENDGDCQPHPSFCATTAGFWRDIGGDWGQGPKWPTKSGGYRTDIGALLWARLRERQIEWHAMHRSNAVDLHPLWFGLYADLVYHHGAAFRTPYSQVDIVEARRTPWKRWLMAAGHSRLGHRLGGDWLENAAYSFAMKASIERTRRTSAELIDAIRTDPGFHRRLSAAR